MFNTFPRWMLSEKRAVHCKKEILARVKEAIDNNKEARISLYAFTEWFQGRPRLETAILDVVGYKGNLDELIAKGKEELKKGNKGLLIFEGKEHILLIEKTVNSLEAEAAISTVKVITDLNYSFIYPNTINGRTNRLSRIIKRFNVSPLKEEIRKAFR